jgi:hypothetical protein
MFGTREEPVSVRGFIVVEGRIAALDLVVDRPSCGTSPRTPVERTKRRFERLSGT